MYEAEPWEALERQVRSRVFAGHAYGRQILGSTEEVGRISREDLERFHRRFYRPDNAVLVVAGAIDSSAADKVKQCFGHLRPAGTPAGEAPLPGHPTECARIEIVRGRVPRLLLMFPVPEADHDDFPALRLLCALLASGRSSCLNDRLVERQSLCGWVSASVGEGMLGGGLQISAELTPGTEPARVEEMVFSELQRLRDGAVDEEASARARRMLEADWVFAHERIEVQALTLSHAAALVGPDYPAEQLTAIARVDAQSLSRTARRYLDPDHGSVLGWAIPEGA